MVLAPRTESHPRHGNDLGFLQHAHAEIVRFDVSFDFGKNVEGALGSLITEETLELVHQRACKIHPDYELFSKFFDAVFWTFQSCDSSVLAQSIAAYRDIVVKLNHLVYEFLLSIDIPHSKT